MKALKAKIVVSSYGKPCKEHYRAVLSEYRGKPTIVIEQSNDGVDWFGTGGYWYVSTLEERPSDSIHIDYWQKWLVESGMMDAVREANQLVVSECPQGE
jgi:G:T-mismatch repair DNA endonuclease (very short patch repair protein)